MGHSNTDREDRDRTETDRKTNVKDNDKAGQKARLMQRTDE